MLIKKTQSFVYAMIIGCIFLYGCGVSDVSNNGSDPAISSVRIENNQIVLAGTHMDKVKRVSLKSPNVSGYSFKIASQNLSELALNVFHEMGSALNISVDSVFSLLVESAFAQQQVLVNLVGAGVPAGAVMPFNLSTCPEGWTAMDGNNSTLDMRGRVAMGAGQGTDLSDFTFQSQNGVENNVLLEENFPSAAIPVHGSGAVLGTTNDALLDEMANDSIFGTASGVIYSGNPSAQLSIRMREGSVDVSSIQFDGGTDEPINNLQPYTALTYCQKD